MPNRLKIGLDFGREMLESSESLSAALTATWLHGATARNLKADVELALSAGRTRFDRWAEFVFDDPTRRYATERQTVFDGALDASGHARVDARVDPGDAAPGMLRADFTTRVFEPGGAFSIDRFSLPFSPYERYIGIRPPRGDRARGMLLTDTTHELSIVAVDSSGRPAGDGTVEVKLYKIDWRWWWEKGERGLAAWAEATAHTPLDSAVVTLEDGVGRGPSRSSTPSGAATSSRLPTGRAATGPGRSSTSTGRDGPGAGGRRPRGPRS